MDKGPVLHGVGNQFAHGPPSMVHVAQAVKFRGDFGEFKAQPVDQQFLAWRVGDEQGVGIVLPRQAQGKPPGVIMVLRLLPHASLMRQERLGPERPDGPHSLPSLL